LLGELERDGGVVVGDMEAGAGTLLRVESGALDAVVVVAEPTAKSIEVARRLTEIGRERTRVVVVANRVRDEADRRAVAEAFAALELAVVPEDRAIEDADRRGLAPIDAAAGSPGVRAIEELARRLYVVASSASSQQRT
jgi:CO dehydrogenase maturation factor